VNAVFQTLETGIGVFSKPGNVRHSNPIEPCIYEQQNDCSHPALSGRKSTATARRGYTECHVLLHCSINLLLKFYILLSSSHAIDFENALNAEQLAAVQAPDGPVLVIAPRHRQDAHADLPRRVAVERGIEARRSC